MYRVNTIFFFYLQGKFLSFYQYKNFNSDKFNYEDLKSTDSVFMRWKVSAHELTLLKHHESQCMRFPTIRHFDKCRLGRASKASF